MKERSSIRQNLSILKQVISELKLHEAKYDLINDYRKVINEEKRMSTIKKLENLSYSKYSSGDYKSSIRALRRSEKYY